MKCIDAHPYYRGSVGLGCGHTLAGLTIHYPLKPHGRLSNRRVCHGVSEGRVSICFIVARGGMVFGVGWFVIVDHANWGLKLRQSEFEWQAHVSVRVEVLPLAQVRTLY